MQQHALASLQHTCWHACEVLGEQHMWLVDICGWWVHVAGGYMSLVGICMVPGRQWGAAPRNSRNFMQ